MAAALRKLFRLSKSKSKSGSGALTSPGTKETPIKRSKKSSTSSSSSSSLSSSSSPHSQSQSTRICIVSGHSAVRNHQIVPTSGTMSQSTASPQQCNNKPCTIRTRRLMKEYRELCRITQAHNENSSEGCPPYTVELVNECLHEWNIKVYQFDNESQFYRDMKELQIDFVMLNVSFPENYPFSPPFVRVVSPHIEKGFVMEGGAICLELLTRHGWASAYTMEAVIMQLCASFVKGQARIKRNNKGTSGKEFSKKLAEASFRNVIKIHDRHGWVSPPLSDG